jgi:hypothetical protein
MTGESLEPGSWLVQWTSSRQHDSDQFAANAASSSVRQSVVIRSRLKPALTGLALSRMELFGENNYRFRREIRIRRSHAKEFRAPVAARLSSVMCAGFARQSELKHCA